jgi:phosphoribosylformylglycinamidine synthase
MSLDGNGRYCLLDPREGVKLMVAECCRNLSVVGAEPVAATNNLNFGNPERPEIMAQLVETIEGLGEACVHFETPITGGNVSLYNETLSEPIYPSPVIGIVGLMKTGAPTPLGFSGAGREILLVGGYGECDEVRFGGTQYAREVLGGIWGLPPALDMDFEKRVQTAVREIVRAGLAESAHDIGEGGLAVALAECCFAMGVGAEARIESEMRPEWLLYHEGPSRVLISTARAGEIGAIAAKYQVPAVGIGKTGGSELSIHNRGQELVKMEVGVLRELWERALAKMLSS